MAPQFAAKMKILDATEEDPASAHPQSTDFDSIHHLDADGNPGGGNSTGPGFGIAWQHGPLREGKNRYRQNGSFVETVTGAVLDRMHFYQSTQFACESNARVIEHLEAAIREMQARTRDREARGVEGKHEV